MTDDEFDAPSIAAHDALDAFDKIIGEELDESVGLIGPASRAMLTLQRTMALAGWEVDYADIDLTGSAPKAEIKVRRHDGRWLWARVDQLGRCTLETFQRESYLGESQCYGKMAPRCMRHDDHFLGRRMPAGPRAMLRMMTDYIADNALYPVALADVRSAWAAVMAAPTRLIAPPNAQAQAPA